MIPLMLLGSYHMVTKGTTPEIKRLGRDILMALAGFVIGTASRWSF